MLLFDHRYSLEYSYDFGYVEVSTNAGGTWTILKSYTGSQAAWTSVFVDLGAYDDAESVQVRFRLETDYSVVRDGWYVDDVRIISDATALIKLSVSLNASNDTALIQLDVENELKLAQVGYGINWSDPDGLVTHSSSAMTERSTGFAHGIELDTNGDSLTAVLVGIGSNLIDIGTGAVAEHRFTIQNDLSNLGVESARSEPLAGGAGAGLPNVFFSIPFSLDRLSLSDSSGTSVRGSNQQGGSIKIDLLNADIDFDGTVELTDVVSTLDYSIGRATLTDLQILVADTYLDKEINVVDVVRGINIILGRKIGTESASSAPKLNSGQPRNPPEFEKNLDVTLKSNVMRSNTTQAENVVDVVADIPPDVVGLQVSIEYDPSRGRVSNARLLLDDDFKMVENIGASSANFLIYSPSNIALPVDTLTVIGLEFESETPSSLGSPANLFQLTQVLGVDAAGTPVYPGINPMLAIQELLGSSLLDSAQKLQLDRRGNRDGVYNLGDLLALLHRSELLLEDVGPDAWKTPLQGPRR
jgi:hypothetical protein